MVTTLATDDADSEYEQNDTAQRRIGYAVAGTYRIVRHIGSGGSSHVFEAEHLRLGTSFAIKLLRSDLESGRRATLRFRREAKALACLRSEHVVRVIDCGELDDGTPYLVMELLDGDDLRQLLNREGALPSRRAVPLIVEACRGLTEVHRSGLVHRDLKPENLFVARRSTGEDWCKVLDFGVAKMDASVSTAQGAIVGTVRYMAPEQLADGSSVGPATDVYALGTILYECLSGRPAHGGDAIHEVMFSVMNRAPTPLPTLCPTLPRSLTSVVERCLAKDQTKRPKDAATLGKLLSDALRSDELHTSSDSTLEEEVASQLVDTPSPGERRPSRVAAFAAVAALAGLVGAASAWSIKPTRTPEPNVDLQNRSRSPAPARPPAEPPSVPAAVTSAEPTIALPAPAQSTTPRVASTRTPRKNAPPTPSATSAPATPTKAVSAGSFDSLNPYGE